MRSTFKLAVLAGLLFTTGPVAFAQTDTRALRDADKKRDEIYKRRSDEIMRMPEGTEAQRNAKLRAINTLMADWSAEKQRTASMLSVVEDSNRQINSSGGGSYYDPYTGRTYTTPGTQQPSFLSKLLDKGLEIGGAVAGNLLNKWLNGGMSNEERATLDNLLAERDSSTATGAGNPDNPMGKPIYDANGNIIGWDRDGDNKSDFEDKDGDGTPETWNGGTFKDGYDYEDPGATVASNDGSTPAPSGEMGSPGGQPSLGGNFGGGVNGGSGDSDSEGSGDEKDAEGKDKKDKEGDEKDKDGKGKGKKDKDKKDKKNGGKGDEDRELQTVAGRVMVLPKPDPLGAGGVNANVKPGTPAKPGTAAKPANAKPAKKEGEWDEWGEGWSDNQDNGDYDEEAWGDEAWNDDWGKKPGTKPAGASGQPGEQPGRPAPRAPAAGGPADPRLVDDLIRVEAVIAGWRKVEKEKALREDDPYAFGNDKGNLKGDYGQGGTGDPFAAYRTLDGRLDLSKVDVWVVVDDTWMDGKEPRRYRLRVTDESAETFDPIHEGYIVLRGTVLDLPVDTNVLAEIRGEVKEMEVEQVVASSKEPPANTLDPNAPVDPNAPKSKNSDF